MQYLCFPGIIQPQHVPHSHVNKQNTMYHFRLKTLIPISFISLLMQPIFWPGFQYHPKSLMVSLGSLSSFLVQLPGLAVTLTCQGHTSCKALIFALIFLPCLQILRMPLLCSVRSSGSMTTITDLQYLQWSLILSNVSVFLLIHLLFSIFARRGKHFIRYCFIHII